MRSHSESYVNLNSLGLPSLLPPIGPCEFQGSGGYYPCRKDSLIPDVTHV